MLDNLSGLGTRFRLLAVDNSLHSSFNLAFRQYKLHNIFIFGRADLTSRLPLVLISEVVTNPVTLAFDMIEGGAGRRIGRYFNANNFAHFLDRIQGDHHWFYIVTEMYLTNHRTLALATTEGATLYRIEFKVEANNFHNFWSRIQASLNLFYATIERYRTFSRTFDCIEGVVRSDLT